MPYSPVEEWLQICCLYLNLLTGTGSKEQIMQVQ